MHVERGERDSLADIEQCFGSGSVIDLNRDGRDDLISFCPRSDGKAQAYISTGIAFEGQALDVTVGEIVSDHPSSDLYGARLLLADLNGDGLRDAVSKGRDRMTVYVNTGTAFASLRDVYLACVGCQGQPCDCSLKNSFKTYGDGDIPYPGGLRRTVIALDVDGDGAEELVQRDTVPESLSVGRTQVWAGHADGWADYGSSCDAGQYEDSCLLVDVNGDGLKDMVDWWALRKESGSDEARVGVQIQLNSGSSLSGGFVDAPFDPAHVDGYLSPPVVLDYDGDGREDLVFPSGVMRFAGEDGHQVRYTPFSEPFSEWFQAVGDLDGNGSKDIVPKYLRRSNPNDRESTEPPAVLLGNSGGQGIVNTIVDGLGKRTVITYGLPSTYTSSDRATIEPEEPVAHQCVNGSDTTCVRAVHLLVSEHAELFGPTYKYNYSGARAGLGGRGWLGFAARTIELYQPDQQAPLWKQTLHYGVANYLQAGRVVYSHRVYPGTVAENAITQQVRKPEVTSWFDWNTRLSDALVPFQFIETETHQNVESEGLAPVSRVEVARSVDQYGTMTTETVDTTVSDEAAPLSVTTVRVPYDDPSDWLLGQIKDVEVLSTRGGITGTRTQHYEYYENTHLLRSAERQPSLSGSGIDPSDTVYQKTAIARDPTTGNVLSICIEDARGAAFQRCTEVIQYDEDSVYPSRISDPEGLETELQYSPRFGLLLWSKDANQIVSETGYDAFGRLQQVLSPTSDGIIHYQNVSLAGLGFAPLVALRPAFAITEEFVGKGPSKRVFDDGGRLVLESFPGFDPGSPTSVLTEFEYDNEGRLVREAMPHKDGDSSQGVIEYSYDAFGRLSRKRSPGNSSENIYYPTMRTVKPGLASWFAPSAASNGAIGDVPVSATVVEKARHNLNARLLDVRGNPVRTVQAPGAAVAGSAVTNYHYGPFDVASEIDSVPTGVSTARTRTTIVPDVIGRTQELNDPALGQQVYTYNGFDETVSHTNGAFITKEMSYDVKGRLVQVLNVNSGDLIARWVYRGPNDAGAQLNELGALVGAYRQAKPGANTGNWTRYHYHAGVDTDGVNRGLVEGVDYNLGGVSDDIDSATERYSIGAQYQAAIPWRLDVLSYPGQNFHVQYSYDGHSGTVKAVHPPADPQHPYWQLVEADQGFRPKTEAFGNGLVTNRDYHTLSSALADCPTGSDAACIPGSLRSIVTAMGGSQSGEPIQAITYSYDGNGNLSSANMPNDTALSRSYEHDGFDRLGAEKDGGGAIVTSLTYDLAGNILTKSGVGTYVYGNSSRPFQVNSTGGGSAAGGVSYEYDDGGAGNGNLTARSGPAVPRGRQELAYDAMDMPVRIVTGQNQTATATEFEYDGTGARIVKRVRAGIGPEALTTSLTLFIGELYEQRTEFTPGTSNVQTRSHNYRVYAGGRQVAQVRQVDQTNQTSTFYLHDDHLGSTNVVSGAAGQSEIRQFTPFGESPNVDFSQSGVLSGFTGHEHDSELGLINMRGRLMDPRLGRFVTADPFVMNPFDTAGLNRYSYVRNNPLSLTDPSGFSENPMGGGGGTCGGCGQGTAANSSPAQSSGGSSAAGSYSSESGGQHSGPGHWVYNSYFTGPNEIVIHGTWVSTLSGDGGAGAQNGTPASANPEAGGGSANGGASGNRSFGVDGTTGYTQGAHAGPSTIAQPTQTPGSPGAGGAWAAGNNGTASNSIPGANGQSANGRVPSGQGDFNGAMTWVPVVGGPANAVKGVEAAVEGDAAGVVLAIIAVVGGKAVGNAVGKVAKGVGNEVTTLFHGSDAASVASLVANGLDKAAARALGGGDVFWATTEKSIAEFFAQANPAGGKAAIAAFKISTSALQSLVQAGAVAVDRTGAYMIKNWGAFNRAVIERAVVR
ncbi:MAG TPA: RHS repeat-associated core domain-containing protein [Polyangiaceae bacterium]|nr:RHS repeat-associated core domain-containing protein [Polyangiaceae bacterium]